MNLRIFSPRQDFHDSCPSYPFEVEYGPQIHGGVNVATLHIHLNLEAEQSTRIQTNITKVNSKCIYIIQRKVRVHHSLNFIYEISRENYIYVRIFFHFMLK